MHLLYLKCLRHTALPKGRPSSSEPFSSYILRGRYLFYGRVRRLCTGHLAFSALYGRYDLHSAHCSSNTGKILPDFIDLLAKHRVPPNLFFRFHSLNSWRSPGWKDKNWVVHIRLIGLIRKSTSSSVARRFRPTQLWISSTNFTHIRYFKLVNKTI